MDDIRRIEVQEAIRAADHALSCLTKAGDYLRSARNWGIFDMLGGGMLATFVKRSKMNDASECMLEAKRALAAFRKELNDVDSRYPLAVDEPESGFWTFADYFFDGLLADFVAQDQIARAWNQVDIMIAKVTEVRNQLQRFLQEG